MALNRDKFKNIVGGITTPTAQEPTAKHDEAKPAAMPAPEVTLEQGSPSKTEAVEPEKAKVDEHRRFAQRGRPKGNRDVAAVKTHKVKVSLYLSEKLVNDLYEWAHADRVHPGEMFDRALRQFHEKEIKRRKAGME